MLLIKKNEKRYEVKKELFWIEFREIYETVLSKIRGNIINQDFSVLNKIVFIFNVSFSRFLKSLMTSEKDQIQDGTNKGIRNIPVRFFVMTREKFKGVFFFFLVWH